MGRVLMCLPTEYAIKWEINHWMDKDIQPDKERAWEQWHRVFEIYQKLGIKVYLIKPVRNLADMTFAANAAWGRKGSFILANFKPEERRPEQAYYKAWLEAHRFKVFSSLPENVTFEGQGDFVTIKEAYLMGWGVRSSLEAKDYIKKSLKLNKEIIPLRLADSEFPDNPRFYHLDTCLMYLYPINAVMYYPDAFDKESQQRILDLDAEKIEVYKEEAENFVCNGIYHNETVVLANPSRRITSLLKKKGLDVISVDTSEFKKSGAGPRCLTLFLD